MSTFITKRAREQNFKIRDAVRPLILDLLPKDIEVATRKDSSCCAFAHAIKRQEGKKVKRAWFFRSTAWVETDDELIRYILPPSMMREIVAFDRGGHVVTGTYQLSAPRHSKTLERVNLRSNKRRGRHQPGIGVIRRGIVHQATGIRTLQATGLEE
jgi:hypothetical protein